MTALYKSSIMPKLDYCIQAWRPFYEKDILKLEQVHCRVTKLVDLKSYDERLVIPELLDSDRLNSLYIT